MTHPAFVIAEAGVNHDGDVGMARELIAAAADTGADAVKFQVFAADRLVTRQAASADYQQAAGQGPSQHEMLSRLELSHDDFASLALEADRRQIRFLATPFSLPDLDFLVTLGVQALKLASPDVVNAPLLDAAARSGLPVILSTGAAEETEIQDAVDRLRRAGCADLALLHCVSSYPTRECEANLAAIDTLHRRFRCVAGFSDHTQSLVIGGYAVAAGARIIEKHLTLDRKRRGPDHSFSLEPQEMAVYIRTIREAQEQLGDGRLGPTASQQEVRKLSRHSLVAARDIRAGETFTPQMLTTKRPGTGISPMRIDEVIGRQAVRPIPAETLICWEHMGLPTVRA